MLINSLKRGISTKAMRLNVKLQDIDPEVYGIIQKEKERQKKSVVLIASENFAPKAVLEAIGSEMTNKYSEGYPGARYYGGNEFIDQAEILCQTRALELFNISKSDWGVNVQTLSGSPANFAVYSALLEPFGRILSLDLPHGGHLSHGYQTETRKVSMVSKFFTSVPYRLDERTGLINYEEVQLLADRFRPGILICGASAYPRQIDFARMRKIADSVKAVLLCDIAHISGLIAAGVHPSPFPHAHIVTTTTHKTLRGPRGAMIFSRKEFEEKINQAVFPGLQGGPHNHVISGLAVALKLAATPEFKEYQTQVIKNCKVLATELKARGYDLVSGGTDNHLLLIDLRNKGINGSKTEKVCEFASLTLNKNTIPGDRSAVNPSGLRIGTPAMTSRGAIESDFKLIAEYIDRAIKIAVNTQAGNVSQKVKEFTNELHSNTPHELLQLKAEVEAFASNFEVIGN